jgi:hypothetical protein
VSRRAGFFLGYFPAGLLANCWAAASWKNPAALATCQSMIAVVI